MQKSECRMQNENRLRPRSRAWIWFFVALAVMSAAAVTLTLVYNLSIQLRPGGVGRGPAALESQRAARLRSAIPGKDHPERRGDRIELVRRGARRQGGDGEARRPLARGRGLPERTVEGQFAEIERGLQLDQAEGARATTRRRRSTCATAIRRTTSGGCAAAAIGWSGTSICSSQARERGGRRTA